MKKAVADRWVAALRSGIFKQGTKAELKSEKGYCCLGVLCEIENLLPHSEDETLSYDGICTVGMKSEIGLLPWGGDISRSLAGLNDGTYREIGRLSFDEIADIIQINYKEL